MRAFGLNNRTLSDCVAHVPRHGQLILEEFNLQDENVDNVRAFVDELNQLTHRPYLLDFSNCRITAENMRLISEIHPDQATFEDIRCSLYSNTTSLCLSYFVDLVKKCKLLRALQLNGEFFDQNLGVTRFVMNALLSVSHLTVLHMVNETLTPETFPVVAACLATNTTLTSLSFGGSRLGTSFTDHAGKFLGNPNWISLDLHWMDLGDRDFAVIAAAITANPNLAKINVVSNVATSAGYTPLLDAIAGSPSLKSVHASLLAYDIASFRRVSALIRTNTTIKTLILESLIYTNVVEEVRQYHDNTPMLILAMLDNTTVRKLHIPSNPLNPAYTNLFTKFVLVNQTLRHIKFSGTRFKPHKQIRSAFEYNGAFTKLPKLPTKYTQLAAIKARNKSNHVRKEITFTELLVLRPITSKSFKIAKHY